MGKRPPATASRTPARTDRKEELLTLASQLFAERGFHNTSMQDIADVAGIQKASIYYYYKSKDAILSDVLLEGVSDLLRDAREAVASSTNPEEQLRALLRAHVRNLRRNLNQVIVFLHERRALDGRPEFSQYFEWRREYDAMYVGILRAGQEQGLFCDGDPRVMAYGILGSYNWLVQWWKPDGPLSIDEIHQVLAEMALKGVRRTTEP
jgi:AcrR family transcriptional regulator